MFSMILVREVAGLVFAL